MTPRDLTIKWLFYSGAALICLVLQQLLNPIQIWGIHPFILPLVPVMPAMLEGQSESALFAVGCGVFCDLLFPAQIPCLYTLAFLAAALAAGQLAGRIIMPGFLCALLSGLIAFVCTDLLQILAHTAGATRFSDAALLSGQELLLSVPFALLLYPLFRTIHRRAANE